MHPRNRRPRRRPCSRKPLRFSLRRLRPLQRYPRFLLRRFRPPQLLPRFRYSRLPLLRQSPRFLFRRFRPPQLFLRYRHSRLPFLRKSHLSHSRRFRPWRLFLPHLRPLFLLRPHRLRLSLPPSRLYTHASAASQYPPQAYMQAPPYYASQADSGKSYSVSGAIYPNFDKENVKLNQNESTNLGMIMSVPLQITVEIGRTSKKIKEILDFSAGTIVELNRQAGSQVDVYVNGKAIAKGNVVVVDDNYGVRITEVMNSSEIMKIL